MWSVSDGAVTTRSVSIYLFLMLPFPSSTYEPTVGFGLVFKGASDNESCKNQYKGWFREDKVGHDSQCVVTTEERLGQVTVEMNVIEFV